MSYLLRRAGGTYYFRRAIPEAARANLGGRREWVRSLGTKDRAEAKRLLAAALTNFDAAVEEALGADYARSASVGRTARPSTLSVVPVRRSPVSLITAFESYAREQGIKPGTAAEWRSIIHKLVAFVGYDDAARLTVSDLDRWKDALLIVDQDGRTRRSAKTVKDKYISAVRATLNWIVEARLISENVAIKVSVRTPRKLRVRGRDFTAGEAKQILQHSLMPMRVGLREEQMLARRWIPWLCAYTGARVNEIGQLRGRDIVKMDGAYALMITPEAGTVKNNMYRVIPLHYDIIRQGFVEVAERFGDTPIFYNLKRIRNPSPHNRYFKKVGEGLRDWVRQEIGITDPNVHPNHGWRHMFKTRAIEAEIPERVTDAIQGHAPRSVGQAYGSVPFSVMAKAIARIPAFIINCESLCNSVDHDPIILSDDS